MQGWPQLCSAVNRQPSMPSAPPVGTHCSRSHTSPVSRPNMVWDSSATLQSHSRACPGPSTSAKGTVLTNPLVLARRRPAPRGCHRANCCCKCLALSMLRSALSRLAPAAAASQRCTPICLSAFGGQPLSVQPLGGSLQQTRSVISVKVYPGKLQAAQRALTRVLMGDKVRTLPLCTTCCLLVNHGRIARSM